MSETTGKIIGTRNFPTAFHFILDDNRKMGRKGWNGQGKNDQRMYIEVQRPDENSKMTSPYLFMVIELGGEFTRVPWTPSQADLFAQDWIEVTE